MENPNRTSNGPRPGARDPGSAEYRAAANNRANQKNPHHPSYAKSRDKK